MANICVKIPFISIAAEQANLFSVDNVSSGNLVLQHESRGFCVSLLFYRSSHFSGDIRKKRYSAIEVAIFQIRNK